MKYRLRYPLPFLQAGKVFAKGLGVGDRCGVDLGMQNKHGAHRGVTIFERHEDKILTDIISRDDWVEAIPQTVQDVFLLIDSGVIDKETGMGMLQLREK